MHVLFMNPFSEHLSIEYLSSILKNDGHTTVLVTDPLLFNDGFIEIKPLAKMFSYKKRILSKITKSKPDIILFTVVSDKYSWAIEYAKNIKKKINVPIVFGGIHPTARPDDVISHNCVDYVCVGEGERTISELCHALENGDNVSLIPNLVYKKNGFIKKNKMGPLLKNLDKLPFPDKDIYLRNDPVYPKLDYYGCITSRGCPNTCTYCNNSCVKTIYASDELGYLRRRSVDSVISELRQMKKKGAWKWVLFHDEDFVYDKVWLREFALKYSEEINLPYFCWVYPTHIDEEVAALLKKSNCVEVEMGVQTIYESTRRKILKRYTSNTAIANAIDLLNKYKIWLSVDCMLGIPEQTEQEIIDMGDFFSIHKPEMLQVVWLRYYPATEIIRIAEHLGYDKDKLRESEESITERPLLSGGDSSSWERSQLQGLLYLSIFLSRGLFTKLKEKKRYRFLPPFNYFLIGHFLSLLLRTVGLRKKRLLNKKYLLPRYSHYILNKFLPWGSL